MENGMENSFKLSLCKTLPPKKAQGLWIKIVTSSFQTKILSWKNELSKKKRVILLYACPQ